MTILSGTVDSSSFVLLLIKVRFFFIIGSVEKSEWTKNNSVPQQTVKSSIYIVSNAERELPEGGYSLTKFESGCLYSITLRSQKGRICEQD